MTTPNERVLELLALVTSADCRPAHLLCDRHPPDGVAFTVVAPDLATRDLTYGWLHDRSERAAAAFSRLGIEPGDRVATLMGKSEDLVVTLLGIWRLGAVHVPLFTAFAYPAIAARLLPSAAKVVVCDSSQRSKLDPSGDIRASAPWKIVVAGDAPAMGGEDVSLRDLLDAEAPGFPPATRTDRDPIVELFTSGTTGAPKGVLVPVRALAPFQIYMEYGLDVREDDVFWNAADPGWAYGLYYGILGPLVTGRRNLLLHAGFDSQLTWQILRELEVTNLAAAPTVYRALRSAVAEPPAGLSLRVCSSAGEPLNPEVVTWAEQALGVAVRDHYGQTEFGMAIVNGWNPDTIRPLRSGSMGHPMPGFSAAVLAGDDDVPAPVGAVGRIAIDVSGSQLMWFTAYSGAPELAAERFSADGRWYYTGDAGSVDDDGYFFFSARDDDVIIMAGYRISPFEVESALMTHSAVVEAAVVGVPDELRGEVLEAFVVLREDAEPGEELVVELQQHVKQRYAAHAYPRRIHIVEELPKTPSGKTQRFVLRQQLRTEEGG